MVKTLISRTSANALRGPIFSVGLQRGFTLIELLVVFAVAAVLLSVAPFAYERLMTSSQYRSTLRDMVSSIRSARAQAEHHGREARFNVNLRTRQFGVEGATLHALPDGISVRVVVGGAELTQDQVASIRFLPGGGASGGSIDVIRPSGDGTRLRVDWFSGRVEQEPIVP